jgi:hypothetical protein
MEVGYEGADWIHLNQNRYLWRILVNTVLNIRVLHKQRVSLFSE